MKYRIRRVGLVLFTLALLAPVIYGVAFAIQKARERERLNVFESGLHDPRTGQAGDDLLDFAGEAQMVFAVFYNSGCGACQEFAPVVVEMHERIRHQEYGHRVAFMFVNLGAETDGEVVDFANEHGVPADIPVLAGLTEEMAMGLAFLPADVVDMGGQDLPKGVPSTLLVLEEPMVDGTVGWVSYGFKDGPYEPERLYATVEFYDDFRNALGF